MGTIKIPCPFCEKVKFKIKTEKKTGQFIELQGGLWEPLLLKIGEDEWVKDVNRGIAITCKCGQVSYISVFKADSDNIELSKTLPIGRSKAVFCKTCKIAFIDSEFVCPTCKSRI